MSFEVKYSDLGGRIGKLNTAHGILDTPAFIPVVHPVKQIIDINLLKRIGFRAVITNAYITLKHYIYCNNDENIFFKYSKITPTW